MYMNHSVTIPYIWQWFQTKDWVSRTVLTPGFYLRKKNIYFLTLPLGLMQIENLAVKYIFANNLHWLGVVLNQCLVGGLEAVNM